MCIKLKTVLNRPLTPHLTIYSSQLTSIYSIWHRITGIILILTLISYISFLKFNSFFIYSIISESYLNINLWIQNTLFLNLVIFFLYHMLNGIRHISWDLGFILPIKTVLNSAKFLVLILVGYIILLISKIVT